MTRRIGLNNAQPERALTRSWSVAPTERLVGYHSPRFQYGSGL
jgi:hypothetical protein